MSKGSNRRPMQIPPEEFDQRWEETFGVVAKMAAEMAEGHWEYDEADVHFGWLESFVRHELDPHRAR